MSEIFGRKKLLLIAITAFSIGSVLCAVSTSIEMLVISRAIQGLGGGGLITMVEMIITDLVPKEERARYWTIIALVWTAGTVTGTFPNLPFLSKDPFWAPLSLRMRNGDGTGPGSCINIRIFLINLPICLIAFVGILQFLNVPSHVHIRFADKIRRIDWKGTVIFITSSTLLLFGITVGGTVFKWTSPWVLLSIILGVVGLCIFLLVEAYMANEPMIPLKVFRSRTAVSAYLGVFLHAMVPDVPVLTDM